MPARQKMQPVEVLIVFAILGILMSVAIPAMKQSQRRAQHLQHAARHYAPSRGTSASDGQLNTIQVSELSQNAEHRNPLAWVGVLVGFVPIIVSIAVVAVIFSRFRQQMTRRRAR
jgi:Tfp pilus assembly protein FimT